MEIKEYYCDLFDCADIHNIKNPYYAHCVSADLAMGKRIAKEFDQRFRIKYILKSNTTLPRIVNWPACFRVGRVYNIITKERYWHKPTYETFQAGLFKLRKMLEKDQVDTLIIPRIGCGLDCLEWSKVKSMIINTFALMNISIIVCSLDD